MARAHASDGLSSPRVLTNSSARAPRWEALAECQDLVRTMHILESSAEQTGREIAQINAAMLARSREAREATGEPLRDDPPPPTAAHQAASRAAGRSMAQSSSTRHRGANEAGLSGSPSGKRTRSGPYVHELQ